MGIFIVQRVEASHCRSMGTVTKTRQQRKGSMGSDYVYKYAFCKYLKVNLIPEQNSVTVVTSLFNSTYGEKGNYGMAMRG
jgi:hypothetical protein